MTPVRADRRGASTALGYVLSLGISALLISGLILAGGNLMDDQRQRTARVELRVIGQKFAGDLSTADRLASCPSCDDLRLRSDLPTRAASESYTIRLENETVGGGRYRYRLHLHTVESNVSAEVGLRTVRPVQTPGSVVGGPLVVNYDAATGTLVVGDAD
ncbi:MAG: hypothetical protein ABEJ82_09555 [Haloplanus sp.]